LGKSHLITRALLKAKSISSSLIEEFSKYLADFEDWESQALYLLEDKGESIETIIEDLYDVPIKDQPDWVKPKKEVVFNEDSIEHFPPPPDKPSQGTLSNYQLDEYPLFSFKDWKQEHGFDSIPLEVGDIHTIIRFEQVYTKDLEEKFRWVFNRSRYGIRGWGNEKPIKSISKSLLDNNNNPGWVVKTFLDENRLLTDENHNMREEKEIPNPLVLSSRDTHALIFLLLGHPFFYYSDNTTPIRNSFKTVDYDINVHVLANHKILAGVFYHHEKGNRFPIITDEFVDNGFMLYGLPKAIVFDNNYYEILPTSIPAKMIRDSFKGVMIPNDEWDVFKKQWKRWFPSHALNIIDPMLMDTPHFEARRVKDWKYWLSKPEQKDDLFKSNEDVTFVRLHEETKHFNTNRLAIQLINFDKDNNRLKNPASSPKASKLFQVLQAISETKLIDGYYCVERHAASQLLILAEEYPYAFNYNYKPIIKQSRHDYRLNVKRNPKNENQYLLKGEIGDLDNKNKFRALRTKDNRVQKVVGMVPSFILLEDQFQRIGSMLSGRLINDTLHGIIVEEAEISDFYAAALPYLTQRNITINDPQGVLRVSALYNYRIHGQMTIWEVKGVMMGRIETKMHTDIGDFPYPLDLNVDEFEQFLDDKKYKIPKDLNQEQKLNMELLDTGWVDEGDGDYSMREDHSLKFVLEILPNLNPDSMVTYLGAKTLRRWKTLKLVPEVSTSISSGIDWFNVDVSLKIGEEMLDLKTIVQLWQNNERAIEFRTKEGVAVIDSEWIAKYAPILNRLMKTSKIKTGKGKDVQALVESDQPETLKVDKFQVGLISELENIAVNKQSDDDWIKILDKLNTFKGIKKQIIPKEVKATLRDYQKEGVNWLCFLNEFGFGGILADDMGLGKTLQTLAFLAILKKRRPKKPNLVIAPTSVVTNWMAEVKKFVPHLDAVLLHGQKRKEQYEEALRADLIITTYGLLQRDLEWLSTLEFQVIILDEAQNIKNARSKTSQAVMQLNGERRITLTGTPIENSILELWSQFNFLMPGFFGSLKEFERDYLKPRKKAVNKKKQPNHTLLRKQTKPFILRRLKQNVAKELPPKTQQTLYCEMNPQQKKLYQSVLEIVRTQVKEKVSVGGLKGARIAIFDALLKLRQICCDPRLSPLVPDDPPASAKFTLFMDTIMEIVAEGHRVLVFSQFVKMLNLMHIELEKNNIPYLQLDGSTKNREELVSKFQNSDEYPVFLISLKAGGTGINLTAADYVIHYDPWWNPAVEAQATDRAYRIGQKNHLFVYKLITRNSIEEKIIELQKTKKALADNIVGDSDPIEQMLNIDELNELFAL